MADSIFDQPIDILVRGRGDGVYLSLMQVTVYRRCIEVKVVGPPLQPHFGWERTISDPSTPDICTMPPDGPRYAGSKRNDEYSTETDAVVALCDELFRLGYDRLAHGILAEEWDEAMHAKAEQMLEDEDA